MKYFELKDAGPQKDDITSLVKTAMKRLKAIEKISDELYINALQSSALLCLADVRGVSPYHNFSRHITQKEFLELNKQLKPLGLAIFTEDLFPYNFEPFNVTVFSFVNLDVLQKLPRRYKFLADRQFTSLKDGLDNLITAAVWDVQNYQLAKLMSAETLPKVWLQDWWAPHNLRFGMQLGYPGSAISAFLWDESEGKDRLIEVRIDDAKDLDGAWVAFGVAPGHEKSPDIQRTVKLWSEIIRQSREALPVDELLSQPKLEKAYQSICP